MSDGIHVKNGITIPEHELEITTSRSGGPGGQHVNKAETRITIRWNVRTTRALNEDQKERVLKNLASKLTSDGDLIVHSSTSRSQQQNRQDALSQLAKLVRMALHIPKKRLQTKITKAIKNI